MKNIIQKVAVAVLLILVALFVGEYLVFTCQSESEERRSIDIERAK